MSFSVSWHTLLEEAEDLPADAVLVTPLSQTPFRLTETQEHRIIIDYVEKDERRPLQREQFETLFRRVSDGSTSEFELDRLPPDAEPFAAVWSLHPRIEVDEDAGVIRQTNLETTTQLGTTGGKDDDMEREEPDIQVYSDALLLIDALEHHDMTDPTTIETDALVDLYTMLSDVQRSADDLRKEIADVLLNRLHHDQPVSGQFGSVQRTSRRQRSLKDEETVVNALEAAGIDRERVTTVDSSKVDEALEVTELSESDVYDVETSEYVRKADVDEEEKEGRLQGLKDQLAATEGEEANELREEIEELEDRIAELTEFQTGRSFHKSSSSG